MCLITPITITKTQITRTAIPILIRIFPIVPAGYGIGAYSNTAPITMGIIANRFYGKKLILVLIVDLVLITIVTVLFFAIFHMSIPLDDNSCHMINGKQICPKG